MTSKKIGLAALAFTGLFGCGQSSFFNVDVEVNGSTGRDRNKLTQIISAEVIATGAISGEPSFLLDNFPKSASYNYGNPLPDGQLLVSRFQYETTKESGHVDFQIELHNGTNGPDGVIGSGSAGGDIKAGGTTTVTVKIEPTKFAD